MLVVLSLSFPTTFSNLLRLWHTAFVASLKLHAIASKAIRQSVHLGHCIQDCGSTRCFPQSGAHTYIFFDGTILSL